MQTETYLNNDGTKFWTGESTWQIRLYSADGKTFEIWGDKREGDTIAHCHADYAQP